VTGSVLRASGVPYDIRKVEPYDVYNEIDFNVQYMKTCDSFARAYIPFLDVREKLLSNIKGPPGESFKRVESGRGALSYHIVSDGTSRPYRVKISTGSFRNILALPFLLVGSKLGDMPPIYWSLNYWPIEADR
jgi:NADH-quinone oxidoreductase subunit D